MAEREAKSPWDTDTGLPTDFEFHVTKARFGYRKEYMEGSALLLVWQGTSPTEDTTEILWAMGAGWTTEDGITATHEKRERIVKTSIYGKLIDRVTKELGYMTEMEKRGAPTNASVWEDLTFFMVREPLEYAGLLEDKGGKTEHLMPTQVVSGLDSKKAVKSTKKGSKTAEKDESAPAGDNPITAKLKILALNLDKDNFQQQAIKIAASDQALLAQVLDDSDKGFWSKHHAE